MTHGRRELMRYIWKPGRARHQRHLYDFEPEWSHKQKQGSKGGAGLGGESTSLISYTLSGVEWVSMSCLLGFGRWEPAGQRESKWGLGMSLWSHLCLTGLTAGTELIAAAWRVCGWPISHQFLLLALRSALRSFFPFSLFLCS